jgi:uncharacterized membrane protein YbhN (UPF0104 family)
VRTVLRVAASAVSLAAAAAVLAFGLPAVAGVPWHEIGRALGRLSAGQVALLGALWLAGLWVYTLVLTAALPGLTAFRGFQLNALGSAVSNVVPFGGAAGVGLTVALTRRWRFTGADVAAFVVLTGVVNVLARLALPGLGLLALALSGTVRGLLLAGVSGGSTAMLAALVVVLLVLASDRAARSVTGLLDRAGRVLPTRWRPEPGVVQARLEQVRRLIGARARRSWPRLAGGMAGYLALQAVLFAVCLAATGSRLGPAATFAAFCLGRALTLVVVTPGGTGITETGTAALLVALGAGHAPAAAGALLFSLFTVAMEIPLGLALAGGMAASRLLRQRTT